MSRFTFMTINFLLFHTCWMATAYGSTYNWEWLGPVFVLPALILHLILLGDYLKELSFLLLAASVGYTAEVFFLWFDIFDYVNHPHDAFLAPYWTLSLWFIFASLFHGTLDWLRNTRVTRFILGALLGPFSYYCAGALNVLNFNWSLGFSLLSISLTWCFILPLIAWLAFEVEPFSRVTLSPGGVS